MRRVDSTPEAGAYPRPFGNKYVLIRHLATGGMADVFLARQSGPGGFVKECVIKRILPNLASDQQFVQMFLDEARLCARLNHPNIAQVYDLGQVGNDYFIAMEHVHGVDLERVLEVTVSRGEQRLPYAIAARIVASIADGLEHAHNAADSHGRPLGIVHRDVTPSNVVVSFEGVPKLLDFGIAKATTQKGRTEVGVVKGKAPYMSPEQVQGERLDGRSDLFSLGAILFELTTGVKAWSGDNAAQVGIRILHDDPTPPALLMSDYPESLEAIVMGALAKRADERIATGRAMQFRLERFLVEGGQHVTAHEIAHFLAERFPKERARLSLVGTNEHPVLQENPTMSERPVRPTGPLTIGDPSSVIGELPADRGYDPGRRGGGGKWIAFVIIGLVAVTGILLFLLRGYEMKKEAQNPPAQQQGVTPPPAPTAPPPAAPVVEEKKPTPAAPVVEEKKPTPAAPVAKDEPKVTPIEPPAPAAAKPEPKHHHHSSSHHEDKPHSLPHLPGAPPTTPDE
jgi:serine/threonine-protein kinase